MIDSNRQNAVKQFVDDWKDRGSEKSDAQSFRLDMLAALNAYRNVRAAQTNYTWQSNAGYSQ